MPQPLFRHGPRGPRRAPAVEPAAPTAPASGADAGTAVRGRVRGGSFTDGTTGAHVGPRQEQPSHPAAAPALCTPGPGRDGPAGVGTPNGPAAC
jgi:hypothetical protein